MSKTLDPNATDASNYFYAARLQMQAISAYYDQLTAKSTAASSSSKNVVLVNSQVDQVKVVETPGSYQDKLQVDMYLPDDYASDGNYQKPPVLLMGLKNNASRLQVTVNVHNMNTTTQSVTAGGESYPTYAYSPYILVNWDGMSGSDDPFGKWSGAYKLNVYDQSGNQVSPPSGTTVNQLFSSHVLNNFPNLETSDDDDPLQFVLTGGLPGTLLIPNASVEQPDYGDSYQLYGSIVTGKDFVLKSSMPVSRLISGSFDIENIPGDIFEDLHKPSPQLSEANLTTSTPQTLDVGKENTTTVKVNDVNQLEPLKLDGKILTRSQDYQLWYRWQDENQTTQWQRLTSDTTGVTWTHNPKEKYNSLSIANLRQLPGYETKLQTTSNNSQKPTDLPTAATQTVSAQLERQNTFELLVAPQKDDDGEITIDPNATDDDLEAYQITKDQIGEQGTLSLTVPGNFQLSTEDLENMVYSAPMQAKVANPWRSGFKLSLGFNSQMADPQSRIISD